MRRYPFPETQYVKEVHTKTQIYLHHTAGNSSADSVFADWSKSPERIATFAVISGNGEIITGFDPKYWAFHLGLRESVFQSRGLKYRSLDKISIGIELCNWGQLKQIGPREFHNYVGRSTPPELVRKLDKPFKGFQYYHDYSPTQIESLRSLLVMLGEQFKIPLTYNEDIWGVTTRALKGQPGVFTHNSVRNDKVDVYPHPVLIEMLKSL